MNSLDPCSSDSTTSRGKHSIRSRSCACKKRICWRHPDRQRYGGLAKRSQDGSDATGNTGPKYLINERVVLAPVHSLFLQRFQLAKLGIIASHMQWKCVLQRFSWILFLQNHLPPSDFFLKKNSQLYCNSLVFTISNPFPPPKSHRTRIGRDILKTSISPAFFPPRL